MTSGDMPPVIIAVFGATGTGKSTFINDACGNKAMMVSASQESCTQKMEVAPLFEVDGRKILLIDTPGFDDSDRSDAEILKNIGDFLQAAYGDGHLLSGLIYMHRITDVRVGGASSRNFRVFRELCGTKALSNVILTTNMWSNPPAQVELQREEELRTKKKYFQPALEKGARMARYVRQHGVQSAHDIIRMCIPNQPEATQLQEDLAAGCTLGETGAGKVLGEEMQRLREEHTAEIEKLTKELEDAIRKKDEEAREEIEEARRESQEQVALLQEEIQKLNRRLDKRDRSQNFKTPLGQAVQGCAPLADEAWQLLTTLVDNINNK